MVKINNARVDLSNNTIIHNINMNVSKAEFISIIGPNGCGKSTLIKAISGINRLVHGEIFIDGVEKKKIKRREFARKVAFLMQFNNISEGVTAREVVKFGRHPYTSGFKGLTEKDFKILDWAIKKTDIENFIDKNISELSGGEKQRVYLAMALAQQPEILILDEPTNHLDIKYQYELLSLVKKINTQNNITIICVLHDINQAMRYSDRIFVMKKGIIIDSGKPEKCITAELIRDVYGIECEIGCRNNHYYIDIL